MSRSFPRLSFIALLLFSPFAAAQELSADEEKALVAKLQQERAQTPAITAGFTEEKTTRLLKKPIVSSGTLAFQAPNRFRRDLTGNSPSTTVCNGQELWIYYPTMQAAEKYTLGLNFQDVERFFRVSAFREGSNYRVTLTPKSGGLKRILTNLTVWLDGDGMIQKTDASLPKGDRVTTTYRNVRAAKHTDGKFEFAPPAGVNVSTPLGK
jgi:outer membrane lipoprotein-sorting protein